MSKERKLKDDLKKGIKNKVSSVNKAVATNVGGEGHTSVSSYQRVVHKDGKTTVVEERTERRQT